MTTMELAEAPHERILDALTSGPYAGRVAFCDSTAGRPLDEVAASLAERRPDVVVLGAGLAETDALCLAEILDRQHPAVVVVLQAEPAPALLELALEVGVRRIVRPDAPIRELLRTVDSAIERAERQQANTTIDLRDPAPVTATTRGRVITVLSPKGGSGKTTIATNLAAGLAQVHPDQVAIVDLDLQFGDVADALLLNPTHTLCDLPTGSSPDGAGVKLALTGTSCGLYALCAPDDPASGEQVPLEALAQAIDALAADFPFVVVDTGAGIDAAALTAIERSSDLVFVGSLDVPSIRSVRKLVLALDQLGMTSATRHVVLNRADSDVGIDAGDVADTLGMAISVSVPSSRAVPMSINEGVPVLLGDPSSNVARPLQELVGRFTDVTTSSPRRRSPFRRSAR